MRLFIDRFEGDFAILIDDYENTYNVDRKLFVDNKEGDVVYLAYSFLDDNNYNNEVDELIDKLFEE